MHYYNYDTKVSIVLKTLRKLRGIKQLSMAYALGIDRSTYSRMESGLIVISPGQLKIAANVIGISVFEIIALIEMDDNFCNKFQILEEKKISEFEINNFINFDGLNVSNIEVEMVIVELRKK